LQIAGRPLPLASRRELDRALEVASHTPLVTQVADCFVGVQTAVTLTVDATESPRTTTLYVASQPGAAGRRTSRSLPNSGLSLLDTVCGVVIAMRPDARSIVLIGIFRLANMSIVASQGHANGAPTCRAYGVPVPRGQSRLAMFSVAADARHVL
jgi:hypothetical protein